MKFLSAVITTAAVTLFAGEANAASTCFRVDGWSSSYNGEEQAVLSEVRCDVTPSGWGWVQVDSIPAWTGLDPIWVLVSDDDPHVSQNGTWFDGLAHFGGWDEGSCEPEIVFAADDTQQGPPGWPLQVFSPDEAAAVGDGDVVRIRHVNGGACLASVGGNAAQVVNQACSTTDASQLFELRRDPQSGRYWLANPQANQCIYNTPVSGGTTHNYACWADPNMRWSISQISGLDGYQLRNRNQCIYNYGSGVYHWACWNDPAFQYYLDVVEPASSGPVFTCEPEDNTPG